jgi:SAM-dependent methyltransferase
MNHSYVAMLRKQAAWREWPRLFDLTPVRPGARVLDLGCAIGDQTAQLVARGASVVGVDLQEEFLEAARARNLPRAEFVKQDLTQLDQLGERFDGIWSSFVAAYFVELVPQLTRWSQLLRPGGWIALTEIDDMWAHRPLSPRTQALLESYRLDALQARRYDFQMGRKLANAARAAGLTVQHDISVPDQEFAFDGPALPEVIEAWGQRLDLMKMLQVWCGEQFGAVRADWLQGLADPDHRSDASVRYCLAFKPAE